MLYSKKFFLFGHSVAAKQAYQRQTAPTTMTLVRSSPAEALRTLSSPTPSLIRQGEPVFGRTAEMEDIKRRIKLIANVDVPVLLQGESGTGKSLLARFIHESSTRAGKPFIELNCPAVPRKLIETELFGYEKNAFNGAQHAQQGKIERALEGTLIFEAIGGLDEYAQSRLIQVLKDGTFTRVGGRTIHSISTRFISIANSDLKNKVEEGSFQLDLLYQINAVTINLPPLRERLDDLPELVNYLSIRHSETFQTFRPSLSNSLMQLMLEYEWPGNIRQLDNMIRNYILLGDEASLISDLKEAVFTTNSIAEIMDIGKPLSLKYVTKKATHDLERQIILKVLKANGWNRQKTAKLLQISYRSLLYKLNEIEGKMDTLPLPHSCEKEQTCSTKSTTTLYTLHRNACDNKWGNL